jgi:hypothetical protein
MFDDDWDEMQVEWEGRLNVLAENRMRRLYCLECGEGAVQLLPAHGFVGTHVKKHDLGKEPIAKQNEHFLVVEREAGDTIRLDGNLASMFEKDFVEWGGAVEKAKKYEDRAKKKGTGITTIGSRL